VYAAAPRLERRFLKAVAQLDDPAQPIAETYRRARAVADEFGIPRPSYERFRQHIRMSRRVQAKRNAKRDLLLDVALRVRPVEALSELIE
jgi:hypothetical protein